MAINLMEHNSTYTIALDFLDEGLKAVRLPTIDISEFTALIIGIETVGNTAPLKSSGASLKLKSP